MEDRDLRETAKEAAKKAGRMLMGYLDGAPGAIEKVKVAAQVFRDGLNVEKLDENQVQHRTNSALRVAYLIKDNPELKKKHLSECMRRGLPPGDKEETSSKKR